jgi:hypothetical protein
MKQAKRSARACIKAILASINSSHINKSEKIRKSEGQKDRRTEGQKDRRTEGQKDRRTER